MDNIKIVGVGDCLFEDKFLNSKEFNEFMDYFKTFDLVNINLETVVSDINGSKANKAYTFKISKSNILKVINILGNRLIFNIANNHVMDYGYQCFSDMIEFFDKNNITYVGVFKDKIDRIKYKDINGKKFAIIGAYKNNYLNECYNIIDLNREITKDIVEAKKNADYVILNLHWGEELCLSPTPEQITMAHEFAKSGVDFLIGHHPHVIQGNEFYENCFIEYSLGNFQICTSEDFGNENYGKLVEYHISFENNIKKRYRYIIIENDIPHFINKEINDNIYIIERTCKRNIVENSWNTFYKEASNKFFLNAKDAWKRRINLKEKFVYMKLLRWILKKSTIRMIYFRILNKFNI